MFTFGKLIVNKKYLKVIYVIEIYRKILFDLEWLK